MGPILFGIFVCRFYPYGMYILLGIFVCRYPVFDLGVIGISQCCTFEWRFPVVSWTDIFECWDNVFFACPLVRRPCGRAVEGCSRSYGEA